MNDNKGVTVSHELLARLDRHSGEAAMAVITQLVELGANTTVVNCWGLTIMHYLMRIVDHDTVNLMLAPRWWNVAQIRMLKTKTVWPPYTNS